MRRPNNDHRFGLTVTCMPAQPRTLLDVGKGRGMTVRRQAGPDRRERLLPVAGRESVWPWGAGPGKGGREDGSGHNHAQRGGGPTARTSRRSRLAVSDKPPVIEFMTL